MHNVDMLGSVIGLGNTASRKNKKNKIEIFERKILRRIFRLCKDTQTVEFYMQLRILGSFSRP